MQTIVVVSCLAIKRLISKYLPTTALLKSRYLLIKLLVARQPLPNAAVLPPFNVQDSKVLADHMYSLHLYTLHCTSVNNVHYLLVMAMLTLHSDGLF